MIRIKSCLAFISVALLTSCSLFDDDETERYYEGIKIPTTDIGLHEKPLFSPDGNLLAFIWADTNEQPQGMYIMNILNHEKSFVIGAYNFDWSPDGNWIVFSNGGNISKIKANSDSLIELTFDGMNTNPSWNPKFNLIVFENTSCGSVVNTPNDTSCGIIIINTNGSNRKRIVYGYGWPSWSPDGKNILFQGPAIYNIDSNKNIQLNVPTHGGTPPRFSPDGQRIIYSSYDGIWIVNSDGSNPKRILPQHEDRLVRYRRERIYGGYVPYHGPKILILRNPSWHPNNEYIVYERYEVIGKECNDLEGCKVYTTHSLYYLNIDSAMAASNLTKKSIFYI